MARRGEAKASTQDQGGGGMGGGAADPRRHRWRLAVGGWRRGFGDFCGCAVAFAFGPQNWGKFGNINVNVYFRNGKTIQETIHKLIAN